MSYKEKPSKKDKKSVLGRLGIVILAVYFCFLIIDMQVTLDDKHKELDNVNVKLEAQEVANKDIKRQLAQAENVDEIERIARENGYVKENEIIFKDSSGY